DIIKDKFLGPILLTLFFMLFSIKKTNDLLFLLIFLLIILAVLCLAFYLRKDFYIIKFSADSESTNIEYQRNFSEQVSDKFSIHSKSIKTLDFSSKSFLEPFHKISIRYVDESGLYDKKTFKTNDDKTFIELIYKLK
ncbi:hypothetical protein, partial [Gelidibacter algens]